MKTSNGFKDVIMESMLVGRSTLTIEFVEGVMPTKDEIQQLMRDSNVGRSSDLVNYYNVSPQKLQSNYYPNRGDTQLAYNNTNATWEGSNGSFVCDLTQWSGDTAVVAEGTIGYAIAYSSAYNGTYGGCFMFLSVGLVGSGADIELTSLDVTLDSDIRLSTIQINF